MTETKDHPMPFSAPMIVALLANRKTQTRRIVTRGNSTVDGWTCQKSIWEELDFATATARDKTTIGLFILGKNTLEDIHLRVERRGEDTFHRVRARIEVGDRLWVREAWGADNWDYIRQYKAEPWRGEPCRDGAGIHYRATEKDPGIFPNRYWKPSIHMFRWACRLELEVTQVRVQRLQDISEEDAIAEGIYCDPGGKFRQATDVGPFTNDPRMAYRWLWESIHSPESWNLNSWVHAISFKRLEEKR